MKPKRSKYEFPHSWRELTSLLHHTVLLTYDNSSQTMTNISRRMVWNYFGFHVYFMHTIDTSLQEKKDQNKQKDV